MLTLSPTEAHMYSVPDYNGRPPAPPSSHAFASARAKSPPRNPRAVREFKFMSPQKPEKKFSNRIEDYEIGEMLGRGGFGFVHRAISKSRGAFGREVAIKMIDKRLMKAANMTPRVANEVEIHWQLHHPAILELYNYFEDQAYVYLVMECCNNGELYRYIHQRKYPLTEPEARGAIAQIVRGLLYLHANGIIHRDLKLSNLLLTETYDVKIADFGLAVKLSDPDAEQKTMCGTPNYISPEIVSRQPYGLSSDVWSLGCMVVTILTGTPPFESAAVKNTLDRVSRVDYTLPDHLSPDAKDLVHRLLQKDPKRRLPLSKVLNHPFFDPTLPIAPLKPLSPPVFDSSRRKKPGGLFYEEIKRAASPNHTQGQQQPVRTVNGRSDRSDRSSENGPSRTGRDRAGMEFSKPRPEDRVNAHRREDSRTREGTPPPSHWGSNGHLLTPDHHVSESSRAGSPISVASKHPVPASSDELPLFTTERLKPLKQKTKHGDVTILPTGELLLDFIGEEYFLVISGDSSRIAMYDRRSVPTDANAVPAKIYGHTTLPAMYIKKYRYASRFVNLVRSKTPKIIFYSPQAKCILMENGPLADFEMVFYSGTRAHYSGSRGTVELKIPSGESSDAERYETHSISLAPNERADVPAHLASLVKHIQECLKQCTDVELSGKLDSSTKYPVILKSSQCRAIAAVGTEKERDSFHPSSISGYTRSATGAGQSNRGVKERSSQAREVGHARTNQENMDPRQQARTNSARAALNAGSPKSTISRPASLPIMRSAASDSFAVRKPSVPELRHKEAALSSAASSVSSLNGDMRFHFLEDVGWCVKQNDGRFVMLFCDGVRCIVDPRDQSLELCEKAGDIAMYRIDKRLPSHAKAKLAFFPQFLRLAGLTGMNGTAGKSGASARSDPRR
ncbi:hypothetical protein HDU85_004672 [Gaertneriomyces sp. JEL0708]|nr:hypothetical protein HDU85_004672 [Gaertneriomyces sp. JEL0708]